MKTTKFILLIAIAIIISIKINPLSAQETQRAANRAVFVEVAGVSFLDTSINFESRFSSDSRHGFGYRAGLGFISYGYFEIGSIPIGLNYVFGRDDSPHTFEVGAGAISNNLFRGFFERGSSAYTLTFTYKRMPVNSGFMWRVGFTPIIFQDFFPWFGIGAGWTF